MNFRTIYPVVANFWSLEILQCFFLVILALAFTTHLKCHVPKIWECT